MNDIKLRELFEQALVGEPTRNVPVHEDLARGRARRGRTMRRRAAVGVMATAAVVTAGLVVPGVLTGDDQPVPVGTRQADGATEVDSTTVAAGILLAGPDYAIEKELWEAVEPALPDDLGLVDEGVINMAGSEQGLLFAVDRGDVTFTLDIALQEARLDLGEFRPCTEPAAAIDRVGTWDACEQGFDAEGRWHVVGAVDAENGAAIVEGGTASAIVQWNSFAEDPDDAAATFAATLTNEEASAIAEAAWAVGAQHSPDELVSGFDMPAAAEAWPAVETALETRLGLSLTTVDVDDSDPSQAITARYVTEGGVEIDVAVWHEERLYEHLCRAYATGHCEAWPGSADYFAQLDESQVSTIAGSVGRGKVQVHVGSTDVDDWISVALDAVQDAIPTLATTEAG